MILDDFLGSGHPQNAPEYRKSYLPNSKLCSFSQLTFSWSVQSCGPLMVMMKNVALFIMKVAHPCCRHWNYFFSRFIKDAFQLFIHHNWCLCDESHLGLPNIWFKWIDSTFAITLDALCKTWLEPWWTTSQTCISKMEIVNSPGPGFPRPTSDMFLREQITKLAFPPGVLLACLTQWRQGSDGKQPVNKKINAVKIGLS